MISMLIGLIVFLIVAGLLWYLVSMLPLPAPYQMAIRVVFILILILIVLSMFSGYMPGPFVIRR